MKKELVPIYSINSQSFAENVDDIVDRFCTCDTCGRHVHYKDRYFTLNVEDNWFCTDDCKEEFNK